MSMGSFESLGIHFVAAALGFGLVVEVVVGTGDLLELVELDERFVVRAVVEADRGEAFVGVPLTAADGECVGVPLVEAVDGGEGEEATTGVAGAGAATDVAEGCFLG